jgi:Uma2 family endonuclease
MAIAWPPLLAPTEESSRRRLTVEEWILLDEDEEGELVDGELTEEEVPDAVHELAVAWLIRMFGNWLGSRGFVLGSELKTVTGPRTGRKPDLTVFLPGTKPPPRRGAVRRPGDILVEIVTPTPRDERRDRIVKMTEYAAFGVPHYWLLDPALGSLEIFERNAAGNYTKIVGATAGRVEPVPGCEGLVVDLDALWTELARLGEEESL